MRLLNRRTRKVAAFLEDRQFADVNWVYRRVDWEKIFRKRPWIDWVVPRYTDVKKE